MRSIQKKQNKYNIKLLRNTLDKFSRWRLLHKNAMSQNQRYGEQSQWIYLQNNKSLQDGLDGFLTKKA